MANTAAIAAPTIQMPAGALTILGYRVVEAHGDVRNNPLLEHLPIGTWFAVCRGTTAEGQQFLTLAALAESAIPNGVLQARRQNPAQTSFPTSGGA